MCDGTGSHDPIVAYWTTVEQADDRVIVRLAPSMRRLPGTILLILAIVTALLVAELLRRGDFAIAALIAGLTIGVLIPGVRAVRRAYRSQRDNPLLVICDDEDTARNGARINHASATDVHGVIVRGPAPFDHSTRLYVELDGRDDPVFLYQGYSGRRVRALADALAARWATDVQHDWP